MVEDMKMTNGFGYSKNRLWGRENDKQLSAKYEAEN